MQNVGDDQRPSARSLLFTILGDLVHPENEAVWTASLLHVMKLAGLTEHAARQALARGAAAGWIAGERNGRETRWTLGEDVRRMFDAGPERVFAFGTHPQPWDGRWLVLVNSIPEDRRTVRKRLYSALRWAGLGNPMPGLWVTPHTERVAEVSRVIEEVGLQDSTAAFAGEPSLIGLSEAEIVARSWDLEGVAASYRELLQRFDGREPADGDPVLLTHLELRAALRYFPFMDPQLPEALLPDWIGRDVIRRLDALDSVWSQAAHARWRAIVASTGPR